MKGFYTKVPFRGTTGFQNKVPLKGMSGFFDGVPLKGLIRLYHGIPFNIGFYNKAPCKACMGSIMVFPLHKG